ncbi:hypothetical protein ACTZWW_22570, partial [Salinarimonas sp. NSM]
MTRTRTTRNRPARPLGTPSLAALLLAGAILAGFAGDADAFFWRRDPAPEPAPAPTVVAPTVPVPVLPPPRPGAIARAAPATPVQ